MTYFLFTCNILTISSGEFNIYISLNYIKLIKAVEKLRCSYLCIKFDRKKNEQNKPHCTENMVRGGIFVDQTLSANASVIHQMCYHGWCMTRQWKNTERCHWICLNHLAVDFMSILNNEYYIWITYILRAESIVSQYRK